jgi:similar to spore coat protein
VNNLVQRAKISPHEAMESHELITFKNLCATKSSSMSGLVKDEELKSLLQQDLTMAQDHITELQNLMQKVSRGSSAFSSPGASASWNSGLK